MQPTKPTRRNPMAMTVIPTLVAFAGLELSDFLELPLLAHASVVGGGLLGLFMVVTMIRELRSVTGNHDFAWWPMLVPFYGMYWTSVVLQAEVAKAKSMRGAPEARDNFMYLCVFWWALVQDLNDLAD